MQNTNQLKNMINVKKKSFVDLIRSNIVSFLSDSEFDSLL